MKILFEAVNGKKGTKEFKSLKECKCFVLKNKKVIKEAQIMEGPLGSNMRKCNCGGKLKATYGQYPLGGYKCLLSCSKSKWQVYGGGFGFTKRDAFKDAFEKLQKYEKQDKERYS